MNHPVTTSYKGWQITIAEGENHCAKFRFAIISPDGLSHHVKMGGENESRALERAKEMIDMEIALAGEE